MSRSGDKRAPAGKGPQPSRPTPKPGATPAATFGRFVGTLARLEGRDGNRKEGGR